MRHEVNSWQIFLIWNVSRRKYNINVGAINVHQDYWQSGKCKCVVLHYISHTYQYTTHVNLHKVEFKLHYLIVFEGSSAVITWPFFLLDLLEQYTMCTSLMVLSLVFTQIYGQGFQLFFGTTASPSSEYLSNRIVFSCVSAVTRKSYKTDAKHLER